MVVVLLIKTHFKVEDLLGQGGGVQRQNLTCVPTYCHQLRTHFPLVVEAHLEVENSGKGDWAAVVVGDL